VKYPFNFDKRNKSILVTGSFLFLIITLFKEMAKTLESRNSCY